MQPKEFLKYKSRVTDYKFLKKTEELFTLVKKQTGGSGRKSGVYRQYLTRHDKPELTLKLNSKDVGGKFLLINNQE